MSKILSKKSRKKLNQLQMDQAIQEWTKYNLWKTAFKKFEVIMPA